MKNLSYERWDALNPSTWHTVNHVLSPDYRLLRDSLERFGWLTPIIGRHEDKTIIDGFHRHVLASNDPKGIGREIPVSWVSCDSIDAMILHVILNRARGNVLNKDFSKLIKNVRRSKKYEDDELRLMFRASQDEWEVLKDGTLLKHRNIKKHEYSKSWVPIEARGAEEPITIERPPNKDT